MSDDTKAMYDAAIQDLEADGVFSDAVMAICAHVAALCREVAAKDVEIGRLKGRNADLRDALSNLEFEETANRGAMDLIVRERDELKARIEGAPLVTLKRSGGVYRDVVDACPENEPYVVVHAVPVSPPVEAEEQKGVGKLVAAPCEFCGELADVTTKSEQVHLCGECLGEERDREADEQRGEGEGK